MRSSSPKAISIFSLALSFLITYAFIALPSTEARALISTLDGFMSDYSPFTVEVDRNQSLCNFNPLLDTSTYYCGYYSELQIPLYDNKYNKDKKLLE